VEFHITASLPLYLRSLCIDSRDKKVSPPIVIILLTGSSFNIFSYSHHQTRSRQASTQAFPSPYHHDKNTNYFRWIPNYDYPSITSLEFLSIAKNFS